MFFLRRKASTYKIRIVHFQQFMSATLLKLTVPEAIFRWPDERVGSGRGGGRGYITIIIYHPPLHPLNTVARPPLFHPQCPETNPAMVVITPKLKCKKYQKIPWKIIVSRKISITHISNNTTFS